VGPSGRQKPIFKKLVLSLSDYTDNGGYETKTISFNDNNKITSDDELTVVILNCILLHSKFDTPNLLVIRRQKTQKLNSVFSKPSFACFAFYKYVHFLHLQH
jgi:hypothetical protein